MLMVNDKISSASFYGEYSGHRVEHLRKILPRLREASDRIIWTAGDSSLDNKCKKGQTKSWLLLSLYSSV